ncbi:uncharacterized protein [Sinocyclocheilus grahami]|uniref:uncharacterized protein n=1 Tax=Sinocyclocheilus grahami TaxID=75366 RepID=UPI0007AD2A80|nr:PREDICTED: uncharacterized protein LOC107575026 [Sinocyclocheilus grahami]
MVAVFLLDSYEKTTTSTPLVHGHVKPPPDVSTLASETSYQLEADFNIAGVQQLESTDSEEAGSQDIAKSEYDLEKDVADEFNDIQNTTIDWEDETWRPDFETESVSSLEEYDTKEVDSDSDDSDDDYSPRICVWGASKTAVNLEDIPAISMEDMVHDVLHSHNPSSTEMPPTKDSLKVQVVEDATGHSASIVYHDCLKQLANYLVLPVTKCNAHDINTKLQCGACQPSEISVTSRGTAAIIEWICSSDHTVWKWSSQPTFTHGMLIGDFMLATNILLSGNNYAKIALLFKFMRMGMAERTSFFKIQDT